MDIKYILQTASYIATSSERHCDEYNVALYSLYKGLSRETLQTLIQLINNGPVNNSKIISGLSKELLIELKLAQNIVINKEEGWTAATLLGLDVYNMI